MKMEPKLPSDKDDSQTPATPETPETPEAFESPAASETPETPEIPAEPPATPETPEPPAEPETPETPAETPATPETPEPPKTPEPPAEPETPESSEGSAGEKETPPKSLADQYLSAVPPDHPPRKPLGKKLLDIFIPQKGDTGRALASKILADVAVLLVLAALAIIVAVVVKYATGRSNTNRWEQMYQPSSQTVSSAPVNSGSAAASEAEEDHIWHFTPPDMDPELGISKDFVEYYKVNPDILGHLSIPGTPLSLPVVKGSDNSYYLNHTLEKTYNVFGVPFADYRDSFSPEPLDKDLRMPGDYYDLPYQDHNVTIYGHAAADGSFFAPIKKYAGNGQDGIDFYKQHPLVNFDTIYGKGVYKVYAVALINTDLNNPDELFNYHDYNNMSEDLFTNFMSEIDRRAFYKTDVDVVYGDRILTLSTCETTTTTTNRYALFCRKVRDGESLDVDVNKATPNTEMIMPAEWVQKHGKANPWA